MPTPPTYTSPLMPAASKQRYVGQRPSRRSPCQYRPQCIGSLFFPFFFSPRCDDAAWTPPTLPRHKPERPPPPRRHALCHDRADCATIPSVIYTSCLPSQVAFPSPYCWRKPCAPSTGIALPQPPIQLNPVIATTRDLSPRRDSVLPPPPPPVQSPPTILAEGTPALDIGLRIQSHMKDPFSSHNLPPPTGNTAPDPSSTT